MQLPSASRPTRVRRLLAVSAAAVAVMIAPTACDYGGGYSANPTSHDMDDMGDMPGMDHGAQQPQDHAVVPVANTADATATDTADRRRSRDGRRFWRNRYNNGQPTSTTAPATDTAVPPATDTAVPPATDTAVPPVTDTAVPPTESVPPTVPPAVAGDRGAALPPGGKDGNNNGQQVLGRDCNAPGLSDLQLHNGFQSVDENGNQFLDQAGTDVGQGKGVAQCVNTEMGAVAAENQLPSLMITDFPTSVGKNTAFTLKISTRNLVRDRFLGAGAGGYYLESSFLNKDGLQRGHFHTACRILPNFSEAPDSSKKPEFFLATEDGKGGAGSDTVTINVTAGIPTAGNLQCTSWAGDGSHRTPMMTRANETPAIDSVRIKVTDDAAAPTGYATAAGNDPAAAAADAAVQADAKQDEAAAQQPDPEVNGQTVTDGDAPAAPAAPAADAPAPDAGATSEAPADETPAADAPSSSAEAPATDASGDDN